MTGTAFAILAMFKVKVKDFNERELAYGEQNRPQIEQSLSSISSSESSQKSFWCMRNIFADQILQNSAAQRIWYNLNLNILVFSDFAGIHRRSKWNIHKKSYYCTIAVWTLELPVFLLVTWYLCFIRNLAGILFAEGGNWILIQNHFSESK